MPLKANDSGPAASDEDDHRGGSLAIPVEGIEQLPHLGVQEAHRREVAVPHLRDLLWRERPLLLRRPEHLRARMPGDLGRSDGPRGSVRGARGS